MKTNMSAVTDPIYIALFEAREYHVNDLPNRLEELSFAREAYGEKVYNELVALRQEEHDAIIAELDLRIDRRIMQLAVEELS